MDQDKSKDSAQALRQIVEEQQAKIAEQENYLKALTEEFTSAGDFDDLRQKFRDTLKENAPVFLVNIINLANNADSESVRASLNKWALEWIMSDKIDTTQSELSTLLKDLKTQPSKANT